MKLLYLSCHSILEYDEISLFKELGLDVFSPGAYVEPANPGDNSLRPGINTITYDPEDVSRYSALCSDGQDGKERLTKEFVDRFDAVMIMHMPKWVENNWEAIKHKTVIWRTIGQCMPRQELRMQEFTAAGMKVVRYSPRERGLENFAGETALIRFYKDPEVFKGWTGENPVAVNFTQSMPTRGDFCGWNVYQQLVKQVPVYLYGPGNEGAGELCKGKVDFETLKSVMRTSRAYFSTGTHPASYTLNFIEAFMTGVPVVALGPFYGNMASHKRPETPHSPDDGCLYEVGDFIQPGVNGFVSDDVGALSKYIQALLADHELAKTISENGRRTAIKLFGKDRIKQQWLDFFNSL